MFRETELKALVDDLAERRRRVEAAGGRLVFDGRLEDRRYDMPDRSLALEDHVLRVRRYVSEDGVRAELGWKGPTAHVDGLKQREELAAATSDPDSLERILEQLGYVVTRGIDRRIAQYELHGVIVRFEEYPKMDTLVEVEGERDGIESAIAAIGLPREAFTVDRLPEFVARFEQRTGELASLCDDELAGKVRYAVEDA